MEGYEGTVKLILEALRTHKSAQFCVTAGAVGPVTNAVIAEMPEAKVRDVDWPMPPAELATVWMSLFTKKDKKDADHI